MLGVAIHSTAIKPDSKTATTDHSTINSMRLIKPLIFVVMVFITVGDLVPSQVCDRSPSNPVQLLGMSVPNWSKPFSTDLDLV